MRSRRTLHANGPRILHAGLACVLIALGGCAGSKRAEPVPTRAVITASADVNPDANGRPSPIVVRFFQLRQQGEFTSADFFALYEREKESLGASLVSSEEYVLKPGEQREVRVPMARDARYVGVIAAFRDIRGSQWRAVARAPAKTMGDTFGRDFMSVDVARGAVTLTVKD